MKKSKCKEHMNIYIYIYIYPRRRDRALVFCSVRFVLADLLVVSDILVNSKTTLRGGVLGPSAGVHKRTGRINEGSRNASYFVFAH